MPNLAKSPRRGRNLTFGNAADQVGLHVFGFGVGRVVDVAADIQVVVVRLDDFRLIDEPANIWAARACE